MYDEIVSLLQVYDDSVARMKFFGKMHVCDWYVREINGYLEVLGDMIMAKAGKFPARKNAWQSVGFVNIKIPLTQKNAAKEWIADVSEDLNRVLATFLNDGYKFSLKRDDENDTYIASMTCVSDGHPNNGFCLVSRSDNWIEAVLLGCYKTTEMCSQGVWPKDANDDDWG